MPRFLILLALLVVSVPGAALADPVDVPGGSVRISPTQLEAAHPGQMIHFSVTLDKRVPDAALLVTLPERWVTTPASGIRTTRPPDLGQSAGGHARLSRDERTVTLTFNDAPDGSVASFDVEDVGVPVDSYELPLRWRYADGHEQPVGKVTVDFSPREREGETPPGDSNPWAQLRAPFNVSNDALEESESYIAVDPASRDRALAGINNNVVGMTAWITNNGGGSWTSATLPQTTNTTGGLKAGSVCCDPMATADSLGNLWFGGIACVLNDCPGQPSRVVLARVAPGATNYSTAPTSTTAIPVVANTDVDKPMMGIDDAASSPKFGRLYVVWDGLTNSGDKVYLSQCDTRIGGMTAASCDSPSNWSAPVVVTTAPPPQPAGTALSGSYIYPSVAAGPDGRVYVTWWDFSSGNSIAGTSCAPANSCTSSTHWPPASTIALLDKTNNQPVPFMCPILAQPGGRDAPSPYVAADRTSGRVYVSWSDLRAGSGSTRCVDAAAPAGSPLFTHLTWDPYVASGPAGALPGGALSSATEGTRLITDAEGGVTSDDWFAGLGIDQSNGQAYAGFYSTRDDASRHTTQFYLRAVGAQGGSGASLGPLVRLSSAASDYSGSTCCNFGNDYGDYTGLDASQGTVWPVWSDKSSGDGELFTFAPEARLGLAASDAAEGSGADGDGLIEPGETFTAGTTVADGGTVGVNGVNGTLSTTTPGITLTQTAAAFGDLRSALAAPGSQRFAGSIAPGVSCGTNIALTLSLTGLRADTSAPVNASPTFTVPVTCDGGGGTTGGTTGTTTGGTTGGTTTGTTGTTIKDTTSPAIVLGAFNPRRITTTGYLSFPVGPETETVTGTIRFRSAGKVRIGSRRLTLRLGTVSFKVSKGARANVRLRLSRTNLKRIVKLGKLRVRALITMTDVAGNRAQRSVTFTLRAPRRR